MKDLGSICYIMRCLTQEPNHPEQGNSKPGWFTNAPIRLTLWKGGKVSIPYDNHIFTSTNKIEDGWRVFHRVADKNKMIRIREIDYQRLLLRGSRKK